jgi:hypothetical protein
MSLRPEVYHAPVLRRKKIVTKHDSHGSFPAYGISLSAISGWWSCRRTAIGPSAAKPRAAGLFAGGCG